MGLILTVLICCLIKYGTLVFMPNCISINDVSTIERDKGCICMYGPSLFHSLFSSSIQDLGDGPRPSQRIWFSQQTPAGSRQPFLWLSQRCKSCMNIIHWLNSLWLPNTLMSLKDPFWFGPFDHTVMWRYSCKLLIQKSNTRGHNFVLRISLWS